MGVLKPPPNPWARRLVAIDDDGMARVECGHVISVDWDAFLRGPIDSRMLIYIEVCRKCVRGEQPDGPAEKTNAQ